MSRHYRNAYIPDMEPVVVYWNFHLGMFSVKQGGRVVAHVYDAVLTKARFKVSEAGRQRVLREKRKNVHATIRGLWVGANRARNLIEDCEHVENVSYNPYRGPSFIDKEGKPVDFAEVVRLNARAEYKIETRKPYKGDWRKEDGVAVD